jgi:hypothetical protein
MATYYVRPTNGNNGNAGTSFAQAWQTTAYALSQATSSGDVIYLCAEATETTASEIGTVSGGAVAAYIEIYGRDGVDGTTDAEYTIQASAAITSILDAQNGDDYIRFANITFDANSQATYAFDVDTASAEDRWAFVNCKFINAVSHGVNDESANRAFVNCEFYGNGGDGYYDGGTSNARFYGCSFHDNGSDGAYINSQKVPIVNCEFYDNGANGLSMSAGSDQSFVLGCTFHGNTNDGVNLASACYSIMFHNCTSVSNGAYGWDISGSEYHSFSHCHAYGNTTAAIDVNGGVLYGVDNVSGDPLFTSVTDGSEDYRPTNSSPLKTAGVFGLDIGARRAVDAAGGGGGWGFRRRAREVGG